MGSGAMISIVSFTKTASGIQKLIEGIYTHTDNMVIAYAYFYFFSK
jgi:hypothetical protein